MTKTHLFSKPAGCWATILLLFLLVTVSEVLGASVTLAWDPNTEPDIAGYRLYFGTPVGTYDEVVNVGNATSTTVDELTEGATYSFYVTCYNTSGLESEPSNVVQYTVPTVEPVNHGPVALDLSVSVVSGEETVITLEGADPDGDPLSVNLASFPVAGFLTDYAVANGTTATIRYQSTPGYVGVDSFSFNVDDGFETSAEATVSIQVIAANTPPVAQGQALEIEAGRATLILLAGTDVDGDALTYGVVAGPTHGTLSGNPPSVSYTPEAGYSGSDGFTFTVSDGYATSVEAAVTINIQAVTPPDVSAFLIVIEAESAALTAPMSVQRDSGDSGLQYISVPTRYEGSAEVAFSTPGEGDYIVWCRVRTPDSGQDSFWVTVNRDPSTRDIYDASMEVFGDQWHWTPLRGRSTGSTRVLHLAAGTHSLTFEGREENTGLDAILITGDVGFDADAAADSRITGMTVPAEGGFELEWFAFPGLSYQVSYQTNLDSTAWTLLPDIVTATSTRASFVDATAIGPQRFYRIEILP